MQLCLHDVCLQTEGAIKVVKALQSLSSLQYLDLSNNYIKEEASKDIATVISSSTKLENICIGENNLGPNGVSAIAKALSSLSGLIELDITNTTVDVADNISDIIVSNTLLQILLNGSGSRHINSKYPERMFTEELILQQKWCTKIKGECGYTSGLFNAVKSNKFVIRLLDYDGDNTKLPKCNKLQSKGVLKICKALKSHKSLVRFSIENNGIGDEAADDIATVLNSNTEIEQLWIGSNYFSATEISKILKQFRQSKCLI